LYSQGLPQLVRIFDDASANVQDEQSGDLLFVLKILALFGSKAGAERIVSAARDPILAKGYLWHPILSVFASEHPHQEYVFDELSKPLPDGFLAVALLDAANRAAIEGKLACHPFNSAVGVRRMQSWLEDRNPDNFSYAHSATAALPFIDNPPRDQLLALAMDHVDSNIQLEAAWAAGHALVNSSEFFFQH
jgi:hypothetical protein